MNISEFKLNALPSLRASFEVIDRWAARVEKDRNDLAYDVWVRLLKPFTVQQVLDAADKLLASDDGKKYPEKADGFLRRIKALCYEGSPRTFSPKAAGPWGDQAFRCALCQDRGVAIVFYEWRASKGCYETCAVACDRCEKGGKMDPDMMRYRQGHMELWDFDEELSRRASAREAWLDKDRVRAMEAAS